MNLRTIREAKIQKGQRVLVCADFDVVIEGGEVKEDFRLRAILPTANFILKKGGVIRIIAYLDRPGGRIISSLSLKNIVGRLEKLLDRKVVFIGDPLSDEFFAKYDNCKEIILFENVRFWPGEEANNKNFAAGLSRWGDVYINDAFAGSHREHASKVALAKILPSFAGLTLEKEVHFLSAVLENPTKPFFAILGGAKLETKLPLIKILLKIADRVLIGGALINPLKKYMGGGIKKKGNELTNNKLYLPTDVVVSVNSEVKGGVVNIEQIPRNENIFDIGPETVKSYISLLKKAKTVVWNGPLGLAEEKEFSYGTVEIAKSLQKIKAFKVVGGGDTIAILRKYGVLGGFDHISLGGGAMLKFLAGEKLPGLEVLKKP